MEAETNSSDSAMCQLIQQVEADGNDNLVRQVIQKAKDVGGIKMMDQLLTAAKADDRGSAWDKWSQYDRGGVVAHQITAGLAQDTIHLMELQQRGYSNPEAERRNLDRQFLLAEFEEAIKNSRKLLAAYRESTLHLPMMRGETELEGDVRRYHVPQLAPLSRPHSRHDASGHPEDPAKVHNPPMNLDAVSIGIQWKDEDPWAEPAIPLWVSHRVLQPAFGAGAFVARCKFDILSGIANELICWLDRTPESLQQVRLLRQFLEGHRMGFDYSAMNELIEKAKAEGDHEAIQLLQQADFIWGDSILHVLVQHARESGFNHNFLARESDIANGYFNISVTNLAAYSISLEYLQSKRHHDKKSEEGLCRMLDEIREGKFSWKDVECLGEHESALVRSAWAASPGSVRILANNGSKFIKESSEESKQIQDRTFKDILGRVSQIFAEVRFDLCKPELVASSA
ncbi:hypothetical protein Landi51_09296 [Colletotrichum acutatum]